MQPVGRPKRAGGEEGVTGAEDDAVAEEGYCRS